MKRIVHGLYVDVPASTMRIDARKPLVCSKYLEFVAFVKQVFKGLYENASNHIHVGAHLAILTAIRDVCKLVVKELTSWVCSFVLD